MRPALRSGPGACLWLGLCVLGCPQLLDDSFGSFEGDGGTTSGGAGGTPAANAGSGGSGGYDSRAGASGASATSGTGGSASAGGSANPGGSGGTDAVGGSGSAGAAGRSGDGGSGGSVTTCTFGAFSEPELITGLGRADALYGPGLSGNGLVLAFSESVDEAPEDIYLAQRAGPGSAFGAAAAAIGVNTADAEGTAFLTSDARGLYFFSDRSGGPGGRDIYRASRNEPLGEFTNVRLVEGINSNADDHTPWLSPDERTIYFASNRDADSDGNNIWMATRSGPQDGFEPPRELPGINSDNRDISPSLSGDQRTLVFCSERGGGPGSDDIWMATRSDASSDFGMPEPVPGINSSASELNVALSTDGREIFFSSSRSGARRLYRSVRSCL